ADEGGGQGRTAPWGSVPTTGRGTPSPPGGEWCLVGGGRPPPSRQAHREVHPSRGSSGGRGSRRAVFVTGGSAGASPSRRRTLRVRRTVLAQSGNERFYFPLCFFASSVAARALATSSHAALRSAAFDTAASVSFFSLSVG